MEKDKMIKVCGRWACKEKCCLDEEFDVLEKIIKLKSKLKKLINLI